MPAPLLLLDGASMWFRSFYGVPSSITSPDGRPVNALRGFLDAVATLITRERPGRLVVCLDLDWRPQCRVDLVPSYKAHRVADANPDGEVDVEEVPDELSPQVDWIIDVLDAFGIATAGAPGYEADDVLGTLAARERRDPVVVVSGDRDLLQVVADEPVPVKVLYMGRGLANATMFGPAEVAERYGVPATARDPAMPSWHCCAATRPTAYPASRASARRPRRRCFSVRLTGMHHRGGRRPEIEDVQAIPHEAAGRTGYLEAALPVVRVATDAQVTLSTPTDVLPLSAADPQRVAELAGQLGVSSSIARLQKALDGLPGLTTWVGRPRRCRCCPGTSPSPACVPSMLTSQAKVSPFFTVGSLPLLQLTSWPTWRRNRWSGR